jgi:hypothetical protein
VMIFDQYSFSKEIHLSALMYYKSCILVHPLVIQRNNIVVSKSLRLFNITSCVLIIYGRVRTFDFMKLHLGTTQQNLVDAALFFIKNMINIIVIHKFNITHVI